MSQGHVMSLVSAGNAAVTLTVSSGRKYDVVTYIQVCVGLRPRNLTRHLLLIAVVQSEHACMETRRQYAQIDPHIHVCFPRSVPLNSQWPLQERI